jgi:hypothetical protein
MFGTKPVQKNETHFMPSTLFLQGAHRSIFGLGTMLHTIRKVVGSIPNKVIGFFK